MYRFRKCTIEGFEHYIIMFKGGLIINTKTMKVVEGWVNKNGYRRVELSNKGRTTTQYIHRLVAFAWTENPDPYYKDEVNNLDRNRFNCDASNLEWTTKDENLAYRYNHRAKMFDEINLI